MDKNRLEIIQKFNEEHKLKQLLSSTHINFLLGAGFNGNIFPQLNKFIKTKTELEKLVGEIKGEYNFENELMKVHDTVDRNRLLKTFVNEFNDFYQKVKGDESSWDNINNFVLYISKLIELSENTIESMSRINLFTFNYDDFLERSINDQGLFCNVIKPSNLNSLNYHNILIRNVDSMRYLPSFLISKIHGSIENSKLSKENIILPGVEKFDSVLNKEFFELLFKMKSELLRMNSTLIIIGYSWNDEHVNQIINDAYKSNLKILWMKYDSSDCCHSDFVDKVVAIEPFEGVIQDTSLTFREIIEVLIAK